MATKTITALTALAAKAAVDDELHLWDLSAAAAKKVTVLELTNYHGAFAVASLPSSGSQTAGDTAYATDGRRSGEGGGAGSGLPVWSDGTNWRVHYDNSVVVA